jgi:hypothetical protein
MSRAYSELNAFDTTCAEAPCCDGIVTEAIRLELSCRITNLIAQLEDGEPPKTRIVKLPVSRSTLRMTRLFVNKEAFTYVQDGFFA